MNARRVLGAVAVVLVVAALAAGAGLLRSGAPALRLVADFDESVGVYVGSDVRVLGVRVGSVEAVEPRGTSVRLTLAVDEDVRIAQDTTAVSISPSLVSDRYVQLTPAKRGAPVVADGTVIPKDRTATPVELDRIYRASSEVARALGPDGANADGSLSRLLTTADRNLAGNGAAFNQTVTELGGAARTLQDSQDDLTTTISNLQSFNETLLRNDDGIATVNDQLASVSGYLAADREDLAAAVKELGEALAQVQGFVRDNRAAITTDVKGLQGTAQTLASQRAALEKATQTIPVALQNYLDAYDPGTHTISGRGNLNELGVWAGTGGSGGAGTGAAIPGNATGTAAGQANSTAGSDLPMFLPGVTP